LTSGSTDSGLAETGSRRRVLDLSDTTFLGKAVRYPFGLLPRDLTLPILRGRLRGKKWIVGSQRHACWLGTYEAYFQDIVAREVDSTGVFYDIGANVGFYTLLASMLIAPGTVFAFEPLPTNIDYLRKHLALNGIKNVDVLEVAVSDNVGSFFFQEEATRAMGRLQADGNRRVQTVTLDALIQKGRVAPPNYIKMDIEGAEVQALLGARQCFEKYKPKLFLATHGNEVHEDCVGILRAWNYEFCPIGQSSPDRAEILARPRA